MAKRSIEAKVRPVANPSLEKASMAGAARLYISKESLLSLTHGLDHGKRCVVERLAGADDGGPAPRREASLWLLPDKNVSPNVVMMTRAFQDASGFRIGDLVRIALADAAVPDADEVVLRDTADEDGAGEPPPEARHVPGWEFSISLSLDRAEQVFPGMVLEGVNINKLRRSFRCASCGPTRTTAARAGRRPRRRATWS
ncbi:hypothetical protein CDD83_5710 [Cordyceps sp. RAO-2017]|nr:hypothetical protein CDD83_5710 [Cordyceps sp. RAO-2017]